MDYESQYGIDKDGNKLVPKNVKQAEPVTLPMLPDSTDIRERAKAVEAQIFETYYKLMMAEGTPPAIRKSCADALADRARGKAAQSVDITAKVTHETLIIQRTPKPELAVIDATEPA